MTYGQISRLMDERLSAQAVGWALHAVPNDERRIPWHRVINSRGGISTSTGLYHSPSIQQNLLEAEGAIFNERGLLDLKSYQWNPSEELIREYRKMAGKVFKRTK